MRRETRDVLLIIVLPLVLFLILLKSVLLVEPAQDLMELMLRRKRNTPQRHRLHDFLSDLRHWLTRKLLRSTIHHALLWCRTHNFHGGLHNRRHWLIDDLLQSTILHALLWYELQAVLL